MQWGETLKIGHQARSRSWLFLKKFWFVCFCSGRYVKTLWKDVKVGDMVHLSCNEMIPADILVLRSSDEHGLCYIDTQNLDGEANLKQREVPRGFVDRVSCLIVNLFFLFFNPFFAL